MAPTLYSTADSAPCRAILMITKALGVNLDVKECNLLNRENRSATFLKLNPQGTVPTFEDDDFVLTNSHAISIYLVQKYGKDDLLYPDDATRCALVNQRLFFDEGIVYQIISDTMKYHLFAGKKEIPEIIKTRAKEAYDFLEIFLDGNMWVSGNDISIADWHLVASITTLNVLVSLEEGKHPNIQAWLTRCQSFTCYQENIKGLEMYKMFVSSMLQT